MLFYIPNLLLLYLLLQLGLPHAGVLATTYVALTATSQGLALAFAFLILAFMAIIFRAK